MVNHSSTITITIINVTCIYNHKEDGDNKAQMPVWFSRKIKFQI